MCIYIYIWSRPPSLHPPPLPPLPPPPMGWVPRYHPPFPSICKLLAAFLRSSFVFARSLQHFWLPASHLLGTCYLLGDLRSTYTPSKYLRDTYVLPIVIYIHVLCIYFLFTTCVLWQHYMCLTYTVPTIHSNDAMHTIPIIPIIHTTYTIHMQHNCHTYHTYNSKHTCHTYHTYHTSIHPYFPNMPYQTDHTHHTYPTYHTTPPPHHRGGGGQYHTPTTPQGGRGKISIWDPSHAGGGEGGGGRAWCIYTHLYYTHTDNKINVYIYIYIPSVDPHNTCHTWSQSNACAMIVFFPSASYSAVYFPPKNGGVLKWGYPIFIIINHPYFDWGFSMVNLPAIGDAVFMETSISRISGISGSAVQVSPGPFCRTAVLGGGGAGGSRFAAAVAAGLKATTLAASGAWF